MRWPGRIVGWLPLGIAMSAALLAFSGSLGGDFVYDDVHEIVGNPLIQQPRLLPRALVSDNWAFRATGGPASSSYWRPVRTLYLAAGYRLFGLDSTVGWHVASLLLHLAVLAAADRVLRRLETPPFLTGAILVLAAVHPTRVESVVWISGFQDLLLAAFLLLSLGFLVPLSRRPSAPGIAAATALFGLALLSKETAIGFPAVVFVAALTAGAGRALPREKGSVRRAAVVTIPFLGMALLYLAARKSILGFFGGGAAPDLKMALTTLPSQLAFYLGHALFPSGLGPLYPLRALSPETADLRTFWLPGSLALGALGGLCLLARRSPVRAAGLALFLFLLAPALPAFNLPPGHLVHDRYLYLPLFGLLTVLVPALAEGIGRARDLDASRAQAVVFALSLLAAVPLGVETARYGLAWGSERTLWERGIRSDPTSAFALGRHASHLYHEGRAAEAKACASRALEIDPSDVNALVVAAWLSESEGRQAEAERCLGLLVRQHPLLPEAWEWTAAYYERAGRLPEAERTLRAAAASIPLSRAAFTDQLALVLHRGGRTGEAVAELESVRSLVPGEFRPSARLVPFHLGVLYLELGRPAEAGPAFREFVASTAESSDPEMLRRRRRAEQLLASLPAPR